MNSSLIGKRGAKHVKFRIFHAAGLRFLPLTSVRPFRIIDNAPMWTQYVHMKTVTVRDLRNNFSKVEAWLGEGEEIRIEKRGKPIGFLSATPKSTKTVKPKVDFMARLDEIWGQRVFSEEEVRAMREAELEGDLG